MTLDDDCRRLLALLTHEMRSPGAVVAGYLRMLKGPSTTDMPSREQKMIEEANRSCARLMHIVQELSDFRELAGDYELSRSQVPVFSVCEEVVSNALQEGSDVSFVVDDNDRDVIVDGSDVRLKQVFAALLSATMRERGNGPVEARAFAYRNGGPPIALVVFGEPGVAENAADVLKDQAPFDCWRGGMGLALPIAHQIVEAHRGSLWAVSGSRAACALSLPLST
jgi:signal transduction histidine kinase